MPPTEVRYGHVAGKIGLNCGDLPSWARQDAPTPSSPDDSRTVMPRRPRMPMRLQTRIAYFSGTVCSSSP